MRIFMVYILAALFLSGCVEYQPEITELYDSQVKVKIKLDTFSKPDMPAIDSEAQRGCSLFGKHATLLGYRCTFFWDGACETQEYVYSCN